MRKSNWTPSIVLDDQDQTIYLVANDFGKIGRAWVEADYEKTDLETVIQDLRGSPSAMLAHGAAKLG